MPARAVSLGSFTATSGAIAVEEASGFRLTLQVGEGDLSRNFRVLGLHGFRQQHGELEPTQPWVGTREPPPADAITPVIALGR